MKTNRNRYPLLPRAHVDSTSVIQPLGQRRDSTSIWNPVREELVALSSAIGEGSRSVCSCAGCCATGSDRGILVEWGVFERHMVIL